MAVTGSDLTEAQRSALRSARTAEGGGWWLPGSVPGQRGLVKLGLVHGRAHANRAPGSLGTLTADGERVRAEVLG